MELLQLKYFKTVAEVGKISAAAEQLFISAPALSTSISRLEKTLGMPLFTRTNNRIILNAQGRILLNYVNQVFALLETAKEEMRESLLPQDSQISILSINTAMWTDFITVFTAEHPNITLSFTATTPAMLAERGLSPKYSFLLAAESEIPPSYIEELDSIFLVENSPMVMVNTAHPLAREPIVKVEQLAEENIFMPDPNNSLYGRVAQLYAEASIPLPVHNSYALMARQQMVSKNLGISFASKSARYANYPNITYVPLDDPFDPWINRLYWRKSRPFTEEEQIFRDSAEAFFSSLHNV